MRRFLTALIATTFALSPVAIFGITSGLPAAHADIGWCDECSSAPIVRTVPVGSFSPFTPFTGWSFNQQP